MGFDPKVFEQVNNLSSMLTINRQRKEMSQGINLEEHHKHLLASKPFSMAIDRQSIWEKAINDRNGIVPLPPVMEPHRLVQFAQLDSSLMQRNVKTGTKSGNRAADAMFEALEDAPASTLFEKLKANIPESQVGNKTRSINLEELAEADRSRAKKFADMEAQDKAKAQADRDAQKKRNRKLLGIE